MATGSGLTARQQRFVDAYLVSGNALQSAIAAGYSEKTAGQLGYQLLKNLQVAAAIEAKQAKVSAKLEITAERVAAELAKLAFSNMADYTRVNAEGDPYVDLSALTRDRAAAIQEVTVEDYKDGRGEDARDVRKVKFKLYDKRAALVDLGKHLGMFTERHEHTGKDGGPIETKTTGELGAAMAFALRKAAKANVPS